MKQVLAQYLASVAAWDSPTRIGHTLLTHARLQRYRIEYFAHTMPLPKKRRTLTVYVSIVVVAVAIALAAAKFSDQ